MLRTVRGQTGQGRLQGSGFQSQDVTDPEIRIGWVTSEEPPFYTHDIDRKG